MQVQRKPYFISQGNKRQLDSIIKMRNGHPVNILLKGRHGMGKSECARQLAAGYGLDYVPIPIGSLQETGQLMGSNQLIAGETKFVEGALPKAVRTPNTLIHLEELNRPESPKALNDLFPLLDDGRMLMHEHLGQINVVNGVVFVATLNEGFEYTGIDPLDAALEDRFHIIHLDYLPTIQESNLLTARCGFTGDQSVKLLEFVNRLRFDGQDPIHISTRRVIMIAELIIAGLDMRNAILSNVAMDKEKLESILLHIDFNSAGTSVFNSNGTSISDSEYVLL